MEPLNDLGIPFAEVLLTEIHSAGLGHLVSRLALCSANGSALNTSVNGDKTIRGVGSHGHARLVSLAFLSEIFDFILAKKQMESTNDNPSMQAPLVRLFSTGVVLDTPPQIETETPETWRG